MTIRRYGLTMTRVQAEGVDAAAAVFDAAGYAFTVQRGGKHITMEVEGHKLTFAGSPRTDNNAVWAQQDARRVLALIAPARFAAAHACEEMKRPRRHRRRIKRPARIKLPPESLQSVVEDALKSPTNNVMEVKLREALERKAG